MENEALRRFACGDVLVDRSELFLGDTGKVGVNLNSHELHLLFSGDVTVANIGRRVEQGSEIAARKRRSVDNTPTAGEGRQPNPELDCHDCFVSGGAQISAEEAVSLLAHASNDHYELIGRLSGGETGAHEVIGPTGQQLIMKWESKPRSQILRSEAVVFSARLRVEAGWPVPIQTVVDTQGVRLVLQEFMSGRPITELRHQIVDDLLDLHARRLGLARPDDPVHWPSALIKTLTTGGDSYCLHSSLRDYDDRTRSLIARIEAFGNVIAEPDLDGHDIVHWDLHPGNLLTDEGSLSAIVDTDFAVVGDAGFDLVMLALTSLTVSCESGVRSRLFAAAFDELDELRAQIYLAHLFIRLLDWPIRRDRPDEIAFWLNRSDEMLRI